MVDFFRDIRDTFAFTQANAVIRSILTLMVIVLEAVSFLQRNDNIGYGLFVAVLDMAEKFGIYRINHTI